MRILIQEVGTGRLFSRHGDWTENNMEAISFSSSVAAVLFATDQQLTNVQLLLCFSLPQHDIIVPFSNAA